MNKFLAPGAGMREVSTVTKRVLGTILRSMLGRRQLARIGRYLSNEARLDLANDIQSNGELLVQRAIFKRSNPTVGFVVFDIGANVGMWTRAMLQQAGPYRDVAVHAFEPSAQTRSTLTRNLELWGISDRVRVNGIALADKPGTVRFYSMGRDAGTSSLLPPLTEPVDEIETVEADTVDGYCSVHDIRRVDLMKIDAEGFDFSVLLGAENVLREQRVDIVQLEYNHRWIANRRFLRDVFDFVTPMGYLVGKVTPKAIEFYPSWHQELETFREGNYTLVRSTIAASLPQIRWWHATSSPIALPKPSGK